MDYVSAIYPIVRDIVKITVGPVARQLGYLFYYQRNVDNLRKQIEDLQDKKTNIGRQVEQAKRRGEEAEEDVKKWQDEAEKSCRETKDFLNNSGHHKAKCPCSGSPLSRYQLSRKSKKMAETIASKIQEVNGFQIMFRRRPFKSYFENRDFEEFYTRTLTFGEITEALKDSKYSRIGVYGMGGVGKTTLVTKVAHEAQKNGLFSEVVMVTLSQSYDIKNIQKEIAEKLNLKLDEESTSVIATRLRERLEGPEQILLILDDIWETLNLKEIIEINSKEDQRGSKILLVSRNQQVLDDANVDKNIEVKVLSEEEARKLFKKYAGGKSEEHNLKDLATKIVGHCGGLPVAIVTIACALKNKDTRVWRDASKKLKRSPKEIYGKAYSSIKISYDFLESDQGKRILLLCCLHEEDANIREEDIMSIYAACYDLFMDVGALEDARDSVHSSVVNLKECCLLSNGDEDGTVKVHDVIRQIMLSIALEDEGMYSFENSTRLEGYLNQGKLNDSTAISLLGRDFDQFPNNLACPKLKLLLTRQQNKYQHMLVPSGFLEETKELRALCLLSVVVQPLSLSLHSLRNLQTLSLRHCVLEDITFIRELKNLVILNLSNSTFNRLPEQIGKLTCLRQLNLNDCTDLEVIRPNVLSSLMKLEELYMESVYIKWGAGWNANLAELMELSQLTALHLCVLDATSLPKDKSLFGNENLKRYNIVVGSHFEFELGTRSSRLLHLKLKEQSQLYEYGFLRLMKEAEKLYLGTLPGVNNIVSQLDVDGFPQLKKLNIEGNDEVHYIVESTGEIQPCSVFKNLERLSLVSLPNLEMICYGRFTPDSFGQLKSIYVRDCHKLKNVLSYTIIRNLEEITVDNCSMMKEIVYRDSEDQAADCDDEIEFSCLRSLRLESLPNLIQFFSSKLEAANFHASSPITPSVPLFSEKVVFPSLEVLTLTNMDFSELWPNGLSSTSFMQNLTRLTVNSCKNLKYVFPFVIVESLTQLEHHEVSDCSTMEEVIKEGSTQSSRKILFPKLTSLQLESLQSLKRFGGGDYEVKCESLLQISISKCPQLESFTNMKIAQTLFNEKVISFPRLEKLFVFESCASLKRLLSYEMALQLESLNVKSCSNMEEVVVVKEADEGSLNEISFPKLKHLELSDLGKFKRFSSADCIQYFPSILELTINNGPQTNAWFLSKVVVFNGFSKMAFRNLQKLEIKGQNSLPFSTAKSLQQLKELVVHDYNVMEHVISKATGEEDGTSKNISFPKLESLQLMFLSKLETFCEGSDYILDCPSLIEIKIYGCEKLRTFIPNSTCMLREDEQEVKIRELVTQQSLFNEKVTLFPRLGKLDVFASCTSLKCLLSYEIALQLESLTVRSCSNMEEVVAVKEADEARSLNENSFPKLKHLQLSHLGKFKRFSSADCVQYFPSLLGLTINNTPETNVGFGSKVAVFNVFSKMIFKNLQKLDMCGQNSLPFAAIKSLQQLKYLHVSSCDVMEHVISKARGEEDRTSKKISFPKLESLELESLPQLETFCEGSDYILDCPSLLRIRIFKCEKLWTFIPISARMLREDGQEVEVRESVTQQPLFNEKVTSFPRLESLSMSKSCESLKHLLSYEMALRLEYLNLKSSLNMEEVVVVKEADEGGSLNEISFPKLKYLLLSRPKFKRFSSADCIHHFPSLLKLEIDNGHGSAMTFFFSGKVVFSNLEELIIRDLEEDVNAIWTDQSSTFQSIQTLLVESCPGLKTLVMSSYFSFRNLTDVVISGCHGMISLFDSSTAKSLEQLTRLGIYQCNQMTQVIRMNEEEEAESDEIIFRRLKIIALRHLPSLESFYRGSNILEFPNLGKVIVSKCPEMRSFSHGAINSPNLNRIISKINYWPTWARATKRWFEKLERAEPKKELVLEGNLNSSIRKLWEDQNDYYALQWLFSETTENKG